MSEIDEQQPDTDAPDEEAEPQSDPFEGWARGRVVERDRGGSGRRSSASSTCAAR